MRDLDLNVFVGVERGGEVLTALAPLLSDGGDPARASFVDSGELRLGVGDTELHLFLNVLPFHEQVRGLVRNVIYEGRSIPVNGCVTLAVFKALSGSAQDWRDIEAMQATGSLDIARARDALRALDGPSSPTAGKLENLSG